MNIHHKFRGWLTVTANLAKRTLRIKGELPNRAPDVNLTHQQWTDKHVYGEKAETNLERAERAIKSRRTEP